MYENLRELWQQAGSGARFGLVAGALLIVAAVAYMAATVLRVEYQTLFSELDPQDAATVVSELDRMKVPYRFGADGNTIQVDKSQVHALRLKLLGKSDGLRGSVGFEIFNDTDFGMTEFAQKINYQRAMQGELTRTIQALDEVQSARVHLVLPESGLFKKSGPRPKASITLSMKNGRTLAPEQVLGIQRLVAASVPEIEPGAVTIVDQRGVTLTRAAHVEGEQALPDRLAIKSDIEKYFTRKLVALFDKAFGPGRVIVSVDVTINYDQVKVTREDVIPLGKRGGRPIGSETRSRTTFSSERAAAGAEEGGAAPAGEKTSSSEVEYLNGRRIEQVVSMPGSIKRLSVGVIVPNVRDKAQVKEIRELIATTVGANPARGDEIAISALDISAALPRAVPQDAAASPAGPVGPVPGGAGLAARDGAQPSARAPAATQPDAAADLPRQWREFAASLGIGSQWLPALGALALAAIAFALMAARRALRPRRLSARAREEALAKVQAWLAPDGALTGDGKRT